MTCPTNALATKPSFARFVFYKVLAAIPVFVAILAMVRYSSTIYWPLTYVALCVLHAGIMFTIKCPHCAYYKMPGKRHRCFMWWNVPKIYKPRSGPESRYVGIYAPVGMLALTAFPIYWLSFQWELLLVFLGAIVAIVMSIGLHDCPRCLNFDCSHNTVPEDVRKEYQDSAA